MTDIMQKVLQQSANEAAINCGAVRRQLKFKDSTWILLPDERYSVKADTIDTHCFVGAKKRLSVRLVVLRCPEQEVTKH